MTPAGHLAMHVARCATWTACLVGAAFWGHDAIAALVADAPAFIDAVVAAPAAVFDGQWLGGLIAIAVVVGFSAATFFSTFAFFHDAAHGALGLKPLHNDLILAGTSAVLMMSAHGQRQLHLRHHARPLEPDDLEGKGALQSLPMAALSAPASSFSMRWVSFFDVPHKLRGWVAGENVINLVVTAVAVGSGNAAAIIAVATWWLLQLTMNAWASHIPHRAPKWLLAVASRFAWTGSPVVLSLVYHLEHHAHPKVPCATLRPDLEVQSPLLQYNETHTQKLAWAQLQPARPRPKTKVPTAPVRGMA
jgi:fatty acid desaturase